ncbi:VOC family protein [Micrococcales bacterium 31B]|nr:VOC family protein [Micrococcales bacterium 31B]
MSESTKPQTLSALPTPPPRPAAHGVHVANGLPAGYTTLTPFIVVPRAREALEFYQQVFGARLVDSTEMGGLIVHAELDFGTGRLQLGEPNPDYGLSEQTNSEGVCYSLALYCPDVDAAVERAVAAGAELREPTTDFVSGDRFASVHDPFGVRWNIMTRVEDVSEEESARRVAEWASSMQMGHETDLA